MSGIFLIAVGVLWVGILVALAWSIGKRVRYPFGPLLGMLLFFGLLPLPVADELFAKHQIDALCREGAVLKIDENRIKGRRIQLAFDPSNANVPGVAVPVIYTKIHFLDAETGETLGSYGRYNVTGGLLIRTLGISESNSPLLGRSYCSAGEGSRQMATRFGFQIIN